MPTKPLSFDPAHTALVLIDLQRGVVARPTEPRPASDVIATSAKLADTLRPLGVLVVRVRVTFGPGNAVAPPNDVDQPTPLEQLPPGWDELVDDVRLDPADLVVTKHQWGAFHGTDLDLNLRRRGRDTIILGGIATNIGVESTARDAWERGYRLLLVEDAMSTMSAAAHQYVVQTIFPRLGHVCSAAEVLAAISPVSST
jgi:nicotinamidase-related amidase